MTIKTEYETGTLTIYPNQYRFVSNDGEDVRIFGKTPLHILDYEIKKGTNPTELVELGERFKWNTRYLLRYNSKRIQWGSPSKKTRVNLASNVAEEQAEEIIAYLQGKYVAFNSYSEANFEWIREHLNDIKRDLRDTFHLRIKIVEKAEEGADAQTTFTLAGNTAELEQLRKENKDLKTSHKLLMEEYDKVKKERNELANRSNVRYSEIFGIYLLESGSLRCPRCHHQLKLRVTKKGRNRGVIFLGCEDYQYNSHSDCRFRKEIDGVTYVLHQKMIDEFLSRDHFDMDGNLISDVRLPLPKEYYRNYLKEMRRNGSED